jgi:hypothetical protein
LIDNAPIKSQCAKDHLYGKDELELHLGDIESHYAEWVTRGVLSHPPRIVPDIDVFCRFFALIQYMRTEAHAARMRANFALFETLADIPSDSEYSLSQLDLSDSGMARDGIRFALKLGSQIEDLKLAFLDNQASPNFVTCDDPVVQTNRLYMQRVGDTNFGLGSAGILIYLPLSPRVAMLLYDGEVYSVPKTGRLWCRLVKDTDVHALNELIFLKARENIYFSASEDFCLDRFDAVADRRISEWHRGRVLIPVREENGTRVFAEADEPPAEGSYVITTSQRHPVPSSWASVIRYRSMATAYSNGSGMGYVRRHTIPPDAKRVAKVRL